ncbi:MlaD family protein [Parabacteroides sp. Marseille-P3160]|uniref:MlaD family protein n=1 Tax=Parabacteroides sp. Marseille-P3160 TaxID=1917887 RepID=UPI0009BB7C7E|nr:MlaD family protein [Parabacteroides sp. Marseille-P3160]
MKTKFTKEFKIGLAAIISLTMLYLGVNYLKGINLFKPANYYYVKCTNVKDLTISSPVFVDGFKVGLVRAMVYDYNTIGDITVEISLEKGMRINKGSYILVEKTLLSGSEMHLQLNKYVSEYLPAGSTIEGRLGDDVMAAVEKNLLPQIAQILPRIDSLLQGLQAVVANPAITESLNHIERTTYSLEQSSRQLNRMLNGDMPLILSDVKTITGDLAETSSRLKSLDLETTIRTTNQMLGNLQLTTQKLNSKDNSLGLLLNDTLLYRNLINTTDNASNLLLDLKQNPKRYVHFSIF